MRARPIYSTCPMLYHCRPLLLINCFFILSAVYLSFVAPAGVLHILLALLIRIPIAPLGVVSRIILYILILLICINKCIIFPVYLWWFLVVFFFLANVLVLDHFCYFNLSYIFPYFPIFCTLPPPLSCQTSHQVVPYLCQTLILGQFLRQSDNRVDAALCSASYQLHLKDHTDHRYGPRSCSCPGSSLSPTPPSTLLPSVIISPLASFHPSPHNLHL